MLKQEKMELNMKKKVKTNPEARIIHVVAKKFPFTLHWTTTCIDNNQQYATETWKIYR